MHGTADMLKLSQWINMIGGMFQYIENNSLDDIIKEVLELNTSSHYEKFFTQVLPETLAYTNLYQQKLEDGVILAKYGLINYFNKKPKVGRSTETVIFNDDIVDSPNPPNIVRPGGRGVRGAGLERLQQEAPAFNGAAWPFRQQTAPTMTREEFDHLMGAARVAATVEVVPPTERF